jgi:hypothetical protein
MRVLIGCEFSGVVRRAFRDRGHDAWSCDLLPAEDGSPFHFQCDVRDVLSDGWELAIFHPPCTYLSYVGTRHWNNQGRVYKRLEALEFFADLWTAPIDKICIENPKGCASPTIAKYSQIIQPYYFGDPHVKAACLWLKNLPLLHYSELNKKPKPLAVTPSGKNLYFEECTKSDDKGHTRSITFPGIARAMADQWGQI